jgi:hypothetical protein
MFLQVVLIFFYISLTTTKSDTCTGCFTPITTDWKSDAVLKLVVDEAFTGTISYLTETFGIDNDESNTFSLEDVRDFERQVVAGFNYRMSLEIRCQFYQHFMSSFCTDVTGTCTD